MEESARYRKLKPGYLSPNVTRHTVEQGEGAVAIVSPRAVVLGLQRVSPCLPLLPAGGGESYVALSWDTVLQRELAYNFFRNDATLRRQRTRDQASVEVTMGLLFSCLQHDPGYSMRALYVASHPPIW